VLQFSFAPGQNIDHQFILPDDRLVGWLRWSNAQRAAGQSLPEFQLWVFGEDGQTLGTVTLAPSDAADGAAGLSAVLEDIEYRLEISEYILLDIAHQPGLWMLWLGGAMLALGALSEFTSRGQIWVRVSSSDGRVLIQVREQNRGLLSSRVSENIAALRNVLEHTTSTRSTGAESTGSQLSRDRSKESDRKSP
jgi:hypothetical protein